MAGVDDAAGQVYVAALKGSSVERQLWRARLDGTSASSACTAEPGTHNISMSPDARFYMDARSDIRTLPSVTLRRADGSLVQELSPARMDAIAALGMRYPEFTTIPATDGFRLPAQVLRPAAAPPGGRSPVILYVYGGPSAPTVIDQWQDLTFSRNCSRGRATRSSRSTTGRPPASARRSRTRSSKRLRRPARRRTSWTPCGG